MATIKRRLYRKNASGSYDTVHYESESSLILRPSGRTVEQDLADFLPKTQASDSPPASLTTGSILIGTNHMWIGINNEPVEVVTMNNELNIGTINGLTVENILDKMVEKGIGTYIGYAGAGTGGTVDGTISLGNTVIFDTKEWIVCHVDNTLHCAYLASKHLYGNTIFGDNTSYDGSKLAAKALEFELTMSEGAKLRMVGTRVNNVTGKIFIASYEQMNGGFRYFNSNSRRVCDNSTYWTSSPGSSSNVWDVDAGGGLSSAGPGNSLGFRPFACISI